MVFIGRRNGLNDPGLTPPTERLGFSSFRTNDAIRNIINGPAEDAEIARRMLTWRLPQLGYIEMAINPQNLQISDQKSINTVRTKAGFVIQYAGENLTEISLSGTTGSAGMEGINILYAVYRSEQISFGSIADELDRTVLTTQFTQLLKGAASDLISGLASVTGANLLPAVTNDVNRIALSMLAQPFPTLAALAANVEMFFQGVVYRGYFTSFSVTETADRLGLFDYQLAFTAYAKQGHRGNYMPWHRQPYNPIGAEGNPDVNPLSFTDTTEEESAADKKRFQSDFEEQFPSQSESNRSDLTNTNFIDGPFRNRSTSFSGGGLGKKGRSLSDENLEDLV